MPRRNVYFLLAVIGISLVCYQRSDGEHRSRYGRMFATYCRVMQEIEENFIKEVEPRDIFDAGLAGIADALDDPHTKYVAPEEYSDFKQDLAQEFGGIGVNVLWDEPRKTLKIASPLPGTPAFEAKLRPGDLILEVDGVSIVGEPMDQAVSRIKGKPGTTIRLKVLHDGQSDPQEYTLTRAEIQVPAVLGDRMDADGKSLFLLEDEQGLAHIRLMKFGEKTITELKAAMDQLTAQGLKGLVLDLRDNPGGLLDSAVEVCDLFVEDGVIVSIRDRKGRERGQPGGKEYKAHAAGTYTGFPIAVLINGASASASEIVAACLQDCGRAVVVGERSFGKGSVQNVVVLDDGRSALKLTVATYWRPSGKNIHRLPGAGEDEEWGVRPDEGYEVKLDTAARKKLVEQRRERDVVRPDGKTPPLDLNLDPQLKKAVEYLKQPVKTSAATT
jgi:carboxyl-terminal processing protease